MKNKRAFSMLEVLTALGLMMTLVALFGRFFVSAGLATHRTVQRVETNQLVPILMKHWQRTLSDTLPSSWKVDEGSFTDGTTLIKQVDRQLVIVSGNSEKRLALPRDSTCRFSIQRPDGLAPYAVMIFQWESRYARRQKTNRVRFVACGRQT